MKRILIIDDDAAFSKVLQAYVDERYPDLEFIACNDPLRCLIAITDEVDLLLIDLEMPGLDGSKVLSYALSKGFDKNRIIILSAREAAYLHKKFPLGSCLAVLNKYEGRQKDVLDMVFESLQEKNADQNEAQCPLPPTTERKTNG